MTGVLLPGWAVRIPFPANAPELRIVGMLMNDFRALDFQFAKQIDTDLDYRGVCSRLQFVFRSLDIRFAQLDGRFICLVDGEHSFSVSILILEPKVFEICIDPLGEPIFNRHDHYLISRLLVLLEKATGAVSSRKLRSVRRRRDTDSNEPVQPIEVAS